MLFKSILFVLSLGLVFSYSIPNKNLCGIPGTSEDKHLILEHSLLVGHGAAVTNSEKWPWLVSLHTDKNDLVKSIHCSGSIISENYIITAGHCVYMLYEEGEWKNGKPKESTTFKVSVGTFDYSKQNESNVYDSKMVFLHPEFTVYDEADIALIKLDKPLNFSTTVRPICLPSKFDEKPRKNAAKIAGWGQNIEFVEIECILGTHESSVHSPEEILEILAQIISPVLHEGSVNLLTEAECRNEFERDVIPSENIKRSYSSKKDICAHGNTTNVQHGDSGGPMMYEIDGRWYQIGVISHDVSDCSIMKDIPRQPDLFTRVTFACDWISKSTNGEAKCL